jgi:predicted RNase H-like HicB family nuclease
LWSLKQWTAAVPTEPEVAKKGKGETEAAPDAKDAKADAKADDKARSPTEEVRRTVVSC